VPRSPQQLHKFRLTVGVRFLKHVREVGPGRRTAMFCREADACKVAPLSSETTSVASPRVKPY
jgi:hypothetical protein